MRCEFELEEWGCASEIKQNLNKIKATPCKVAEVLSVYLTLPKVRAAQEREIRKFGNEEISKCGGLEDSEGNGDFQKEVGRDFGEKRV